MAKLNDVYGPFFKGWQAKALGSKPTPDMLAVVHGLGLRAGKQALANAMALRPEGVTGSQIVMATGAQQLNRMRGLIAGGVFKREMVAANEQGHTVYKMHLTAKGEAAIKRAAEAAAKAALDGDKPKAKKASKGKGKRKGAKAGTPQPVTTEAPAVTEAPTTGDQPQA